MMNQLAPAVAESLRDDFGRFLSDDEQLTKFICACNSQNPSARRFRYWQQQLWAAFLEGNRCYAELSEEEVVQAFTLCHVHRRLLLRRSIPILEGVRDVKLSRATEEFIATRAPFSLPTTCDTGTNAVATEVFLCDMCIEEREKREHMTSSS